MEIKAKYNRNGNIKLGDDMATFSVLYGDDDWFIPELNQFVKGTCGNHCKECKDDCYVKKSYERWTDAETGCCSVKKGHAVNTLALDDPIKACDDLSNQIKRARVPFTVVRIDQSGELRDNTYDFLVHVDVAIRSPRQKFYIYTKNYKMVTPLLLAGVVPSNLIVLFSIWNECGIEEYKKVAHLENVKAFVVITGYDYESKGIHIDTMCNAYYQVECKNGNMRVKLNHKITCNKCTKCFDNLESHKIIGCLPH